MAAQVQLSCLENFPEHISPLDVLALEPDLESVFQYDTNQPIVLFTPNRPQLCDRTGILLQVHPTTMEEISSAGGRSCLTADSDSGLRVRFFASQYFLNHYRIKRCSCAGTVRPLEPVSLDRVVLGARSRQSLRWAGGEQFTGGLLELCHLGQEPLARQGDPLLLPHHPLFGDDMGQVQQRLLELLVLECSPVKQGRITANTSLVLTDYWDCADPPGPSLPCRSLGLSVSDFAHYADSLGGSRSLLDSWSSLGSELPDVLQALECRLDVRVVDTHRWCRVKGQQGSFVDTDNCVFLSKQLLRRLGLFNHEWVRLSRTVGGGRGPGEEVDVRAPPCRERQVSAVVVDLSPELMIHDDVGFISATLWFNMTEGETLPVKSCTLRMKRWKSALEDLRQRSDSYCRSASLPFATELHIQPVSSPQHSNLSFPDNLLAEHFATPRWVTAGLPVQMPPLNGTFTNSPVPCCCVDEESLWSSLTPSGLNKTVDLLSDLILPHLQESLSACTVLLHGPAGSGKITVVRAASRRLNLHLLKVNCVTVCADTPAAAEVKLSSVFQRANALQPCVLLLRNLQLLLKTPGSAEDDGRVQAVLCQLLGSAPASVVVVATVCRARDLSTGVMGAFVHQVAMESPTEEQRLTMLVGLSRELSLGRDANLERLSKLTAGFVLGDLSALLAEAGRAACRSGGQLQEDLCSSGVTIMNQDFCSALETLQSAQSKAIGAPKIPNVCWEDVGGLEHVKREILDTVQLPLQRPELLSLGLNRTGVLLYGPPGTGKTLLAKAVATECSMTFLSVKGPELINMYVGQSEENIREVFHKARSAVPCVVFFDELDSLAPNRGRSGDSGGVMDRVVSQLLAELDSLQSSAGVFVIGATNRPDLLDQSLLRPGRFDKLVYVGINEDRASQLQVLQAILRKFQLDPAVNLQDVVDRCPTRMSGADLYALCSDAMTAAIKRKIQQINDGLDSEDSPVLLCAEDFSSALKNFRPSVSEAELLRYRSIHQELSGQ
uniref:Peroxisomal ATPase PEX6 n=1 Tax=Poecilia reticulata TaxID=8081 RepID=A0A3P9Q6L3_POERE